MSTTTQQASAAELMRRDFELVDAHDVEGLVALAHPDVIEEFVPVRTLHGRKELREFFEQMFAAVPDQRLETEAIHAVDDTTAVGQWHVTGTFLGEDFEGIRATGQRIDFRGVDVMHFEDGLLKHNTVYYDGLTFARQIGLLPDEDSTADRAMLTAFNALTAVRNSLG